MSFQRVHRSNPQNSQTLLSNSEFAPRPFPVQQPKRPPTQEEIENQAFEQNKFEASGLQLKEQHGTITPIEQEKLGVLQARMNGFWAHGMERASRFDYNFATIPVHHPNTPISAALIQPKLTIGQPGDRYEQEADRIADQVMRMPDRLSSNHGLSFSSIDASIAQRQCTACEEEKLQRKESGSTAEKLATVPPIVHEVLNSPGRPLDPATRAFMEPRFGHDFSQVRVHSGTTAERSARAVNALAYAVGQDIVFNSGQYAPGTTEGRRLLAHELTHTVQQGSVHQGAVEQLPTASRHMGTLAAPMLQCSFEDEPVSSGANSDTLVTRIQGILREWKSECQEGVNDFVHAELAAAIDGLGSGSWPTFLLALVGNTIWAAAAFVPPAAGARAVFAVSMAGIGVAAAPTIPAASSEGENLTRVAEMMKDYFGNVFTHLLNQVGSGVTSYVRAHGQVNGNQALISFLQNTFQPEQINTTGTPNINGNAVRTMYHAYASNLLARYRQQVVPIRPATVTNVTDPIDRQITTQTGLVWAERDDGRHYLTQIFIENSSSGGIQRGTTMRFRMFIDDVLQDAAIERARRSQPRGIPMLPWSAIRGIPDQAPVSPARDREVLRHRR